MRDEIELLSPTVCSVVALGGFGWQVALRTYAALGWDVGRPLPRFGHGASTILTRGEERVRLFGCYHVSQQNTFTGRLTVDMVVDVMSAAARAAGLRRRPRG